MLNYIYLLYINLIKKKLKYVKKNFPNIIPFF